VQSQKQKPTEIAKLIKEKHGYETKKKLKLISREPGCGLSVSLSGSALLPPLLLPLPENDCLSKLIAACSRTERDLILKTTYGPIFLV
jgi:hypothetical protein